MTQHTKTMKHIVLGNLFVLFAIMFFSGDVLLLLYSYFLELFVGVIFVISVTFLGHKEIKGTDYRGLFMDLGFLIPILFYIFTYGLEYYENLIDVNFDSSAFSSLTFWILFASVILSQLYIFVRTFILTENYYLPSPSFYIFDLLAKSFVLIAATSAFWIFFNSLAGSLISLVVLFIVKMLMELFMKYFIIDMGLAKFDHQYLFREKLRTKISFKARY